MKKLIQISLLVILVLVSFQAAVGGSIFPENNIGSSAVTSISPTANTSVEDAQLAACEVRVKGPACKEPRVGWNG